MGAPGTGFGYISVNSQSIFTVIIVLETAYIPLLIVASTAEFGSADKSRRTSGSQLGHQGEAWGIPQ